MNDKRFNGSIYETDDARECLVHLSPNIVAKASYTFDGDTQPTDYDCYDDEQIAAWRRDEWWYVGVIVEVTAEVGDATVELANESLWGIDYDGWNDEYLFEVANELLLEALASIPDGDAADELRKLAASIDKFSADLIPA